MQRRRPRASSFHRRLAWTLVLALLLQGGGGCAVFRDPDPPTDRSVAIRSEVARDKRGSVRGDLEAYSTLKGVLVGTVAGVPAVGFTGATIALGAGFLACGVTAFLWPICVMIVTAMGAVVGGVVGLVGGGVMGFVGGLPSDVAKEVTVALSNLEEGRRFEDDFLGSVKRAVPPERQAEEPGPETTILTARLRDFDLRQHSKDRLSVRLRASMVQVWRDEQGKQRQNTCRYRFDSERKPAATWLEEGGAAFGEAMTQGFDTFARWMNRDLEAFAAKTELAKSGQDPRSRYRKPRWYRLY